MFWLCSISWHCTHELQSNLYLSTDILFLLLIIIIGFKDDLKMNRAITVLFVATFACFLLSVSTRFKIISSCTIKPILRPLSGFFYL